MARVAEGPRGRGVEAYPTEWAIASKLDIPRSDRQTRESLGMDFVGY